jgi:hypothetical protein
MEYFVWIYFTLLRGSMERKVVEVVVVRLRRLNWNFTSREY